MSLKEAFQGSFQTLGPSFFFLEYIKMLSYANAMVGYFSFFGLGVTFGLDALFGPRSVIGTIYYLQPQSVLSQFFARVMGTLFLSMPVSYLYFGQSKETFIKQTIFFHVLSLPLFMGCVSTGDPFNPSIWGLQVVMNIMCAVWGFASLKKHSKKK